MISPPPKSAIAPHDRSMTSAPRLRGIVRKSALLNVAIVLTSLPVLLFAGGPQAILPTLAIMVGISFLIWTSTFALFSFVSLAHLFWSPTSAATGRAMPISTNESGVGDRWLDGPV
jgi:hypothetical protein